MLLCPIKNINYTNSRTAAAKHAVSRAAKTPPSTSCLNRKSFWLNFLRRRHPGLRQGCPSSKPAFVSRIWNLHQMDPSWRSITHNALWHGAATWAARRLGRGQLLRQEGWTVSPKSPGHPGPQSLCAGCSIPRGISVTSCFLL